MQVSNCALGNTKDLDAENDSKQGIAQKGETELGFITKSHFGGK